MYFVGLDLAWGQTNRTGVAVVNGEGDLCFLQTKITDDDIVSAVAPYLGDGVLVGIDAPLLVTNDTGRRPAEAELDKQFRPFQAGPYPAFRNHASGMFNPPRGYQLARRLGLDIDPDSDAPRRAIEVYPHPASVVLFRLNCTLKYKSGHGDSPAERFVHRRVEMLELMRHLTTLAEASPRLRVSENERWVDLARIVDTATQPAQLNWAEDQIDAVLCAYIAMFFTFRRDSTTTFGDYPANGYIVSPTLPDGLRADCSRRSGGAKRDAGGVVGVAGGHRRLNERWSGELPISELLCPCGCKQPATKADRFLPGHDARGLHRRISQQWGSTLEFIRWFDETYGFEDE